MVQIVKLKSAFNVRYFTNRLLKEETHRHTPPPPPNSLAMSALYFFVYSAFLNMKMM